MRTTVNDGSVEAAVAARGRTSAVVVMPLASVVPISMETDLERTHALAHVPARPAFGM